MGVIHNGVANRVCLTNMEKSTFVDSLMCLFGLREVKGEYGGYVNTNTHLTFFKA